MTEQALKSCELHVHLGGCLYAADLLELSRDRAHEIDWELYIDSYAQSFGTKPDPPRLIADALESTGGFDRFRRHYVVGEEDSGDFARFQAKINLAICVYRHWMRVGRADELARHIIDRQRSQGLEFTEIRAMSGSATEDPDGFLRFHCTNAQVLRECSGDGFEGRYIISLPRWEPLAGLAVVEKLLDTAPELVPTIVGLDFCFFEEGYPPKTTSPFFERLNAFNTKHPERALEVVYHVGEVFFDKSLESAVRWVHEAAELGARRLGHALALGIEPEVAVARRPDAHESEPAGERVDQIRYDLTNKPMLEACGVEVDEKGLTAELEELSGSPPSKSISRPYSAQRLEDVRRRQNAVLKRLTELGTVIESCPTSNLRIASLPVAAAHPLARFLQAGVQVVIGADDPGVFDISLESEVDWAFEHIDMAPAQLVERLGDPRQHRLGARRE